jgi:hypothetical protein
MTEPETKPLPLKTPPISRRGEELMMFPPSSMVTPSRCVNEPFMKFTAPDWISTVPVLK